MLRRLFVTSWCLAGCASWLPTPTPMRAIDHLDERGHARCLMVFLPGMGDTPEHFAERGFVAEVRARKLSIDMVAASATVGYYAKGIVAERLHTDVVQPRLRRGYRQVWLVGMSMGGLGTLLYSRQRPAGEVHGLLALAPFLGDEDVADEIHAAGGLMKWKAPARATKLEEANYTQQVWGFAQAVSAQREPGPVLHVGYGLQDRLAPSDALLAAALPKEHVYTMAGGHNWKTWRLLFARFLRTGTLEACR